MLYLKAQFRAKESNVTDEILVKLAKGGNESAFAELMQRSWDRSMRLALSHLHDREDAIDEVQSAYWKAYTHLATFEENSKFSTWVGKIVINRCIMRLRALGRQNVLSFDNLPNSTEAPYMRDSYRWSDPEAKFASREISDLVLRELQCLPRLLRTAVEMRHVQGLPLDQIALRLGIPVGAVKTRVNRGNRYLRDRMTKHLGRKGVASLLQ